MLPPRLENPEMGEKRQQSFGGTGNSPLRRRNIDWKEKQKKEEHVVEGVLGRYLFHIACHAHEEEHW